MPSPKSSARGREPEPNGGGGARAAGQEQAAEPGFDERLARLERLVAELESGQLGLEQGIERYAEGVELLRGCQAQLAGYRRRVEELSAAAEGALEPYPGDPDVAAPGHG